MFLVFWSAVKFLLFVFLFKFIKRGRCNEIVL